MVPDKLLDMVDQSMRVLGTYIWRILRLIVGQELIWTLTV